MIHLTAAFTAQKGQEENKWQCVNHPFLRQKATGQKSLHSSNLLFLCLAFASSGFLLFKSITQHLLSLLFSVSHFVLYCYFSLLLPMAQLAFDSQAPKAE